MSDSEADAQSDAGNSTQGMLQEINISADRIRSRNRGGVIREESMSLEDMGVLRQDDSFEIIDRQWLEFPESKMRPLLSCAVTANAECLERSALKPTGMELLWTGIGYTMPENLQKVVWCMEQINEFPNFTGSVVSTADTRLVYNTLTKGKARPITGILQRVNNEDFSEVRAICHDWPVPGEENPSFMKRCLNKMSGRDNVYYAVPKLVTMEWGVIPVEYMDSKGGYQRQIIHVLRVVPAQGFDLLRFIETRIFGQLNQRQGNTSIDVAKIAELLTVAMDYEMKNMEPDENIWRGHEHPWSMNDFQHALCPLNILSPFTIFYKIRTMIGHYESGSLIIDGFPNVTTADRFMAIDAHYERLNCAYLASMQVWRSQFQEAMRLDGEGAGNKTILTSVLFSGNKNLDRINCGLNIKVNLRNGIYQMKDYSKMVKIRLPDLAMAAITFFTFVDGNSLFDNIVRETFIDSSVANKAERVTRTFIFEKYMSANANPCDFPYAGMLAHSRHAQDLTILNLVKADKPIGDRAMSMRRYVTVQLTILARSLLMDMFMSDRIMEQARILDNISERPNICASMLQSSHFFANEMDAVMKDAEQAILCDEQQRTEFYLASAWMFMNQTAKMNALNLNGTKAVAVSDVLTFFGMHQKTWTWMGYTNIFIGGGGHMRALTEESHGRVQSIYLVKVNSAGYTNVILAGVNMIMSLLVDIIPGISGSAIKLMQVHKMDRGTRSAMESLSSVEYLDGKIIALPDRSQFMCMLAWDEWFRNLDKDAVKAAVTLLPRDSTAGTGCVVRRTADPDKKNSMPTSTIQQIEGCTPCVIAIAGNSQPPDGVFAEAAKALVCVFNSMCPGAQPAQSSIQEFASLKRKLEEYVISNTTGSSTLPIDAEIRQHLGNLLCLVPMIVKQQIALTNKTGLVTYEICPVHRNYLEWFFDYYRRCYEKIMGTTLLMSYGRITSIQVTRTIAACAISTQLLHLNRHNANYAEACINAVSDMISSPLSIAKCACVMREAIGKTVCTNMLMVNGIVEAILHTPTVSMDFLCSCLDPRLNIDNTTEDYVILREFLQSISDARAGAGVDEGGRCLSEVAGSYIVVPDLPYSKRYRQYQVYLEQYMSVVKGSEYTYMEALRECLSRSIDMAFLLGLEQEDVRLSALMRRFGIRYEDEWDVNPDLADAPGANFLFANYDQNREATMTRCWINVVMHLVISSLVGPIPLHSDNRDAFACNLFRFIAMRHFPAQCIPARTIIFDTFGMNNGAIRPQVLRIRGWTQPDYFLRSVLDTNAWDQHVMTELDVGAWNYAIEDVFHMGPWLQMASILNAGHPPSEITHIPGISYRMPELVVGRYYPLWRDDECAGTICVSPLGKAFVAIVIDDVELAVEFEHWQYIIQRELEAVVGPLINRGNAVVNMNGAIGIIVPRYGESMCSGVDFKSFEGWRDEFSTQAYETEERYFLDHSGHYQVFFGDGALTKHHVDHVHKCLIKLGTRLIVNIRELKDEYPKLGPKFTHATRVEYIMGWLRYPCKETIDPCPEYVYISFRVKRTCSQIEEPAKILGIPVSACRLPVEGMEIVDYMLP